LDGYSLLYGPKLKRCFLRDQQSNNLVSCVHYVYIKTFHIQFDGFHWYYCFAPQIIDLK